MQNVFVCQIYINLFIHVPTIVHLLTQINAEFKLHQIWIKIDMNINLYFSVLYIFHYLFFFYLV